MKMTELIAIAECKYAHHVRVIVKGKVIADQAVAPSELNTGILPLVWETYGLIDRQSPEGVCLAADAALAALLAANAALVDAVIASGVAVVEMKVGGVWKPFD